MNSEPLALLLKLVASHAKALAHGPQLSCLVQIHKLIGWLRAPMLAGVAGHPVIIQKRRQCIQCIQCIQLLNLSICVFYVCISNISSYFLNSSKSLIDIKIFFASISNYFYVLAKSYSL